PVRVNRPCPHPRLSSNQTRRRHERAGRVNAPRTIVTCRHAALLARMEAVGVGTRELGRRADVNRSTISRLRSGPGVNTDKAKAERIAEALGVHVGDLFMHTDGTPLTGSVL